MHTKRKVTEAAGALRKLGIGAPARAIVLEAQMGGFSNELSRLRVVPFRKIRHFPEPLIAGRGGAVLFGELDGVPTIVQEGRVHLFEGYLPGEVVFPLRTFVALGVRQVAFVATGRSLDPGCPAGEILLVADHLNLTGVTPLRGIRDEERTPFIDVPEAPPGVRAAAATAAADAGLGLAAGVAALIHGPAWPTPAETRMLRLFGADAASPALAPELAMAAYLGVESAAFLLLGAGSGGWGKRHLDFCRAFLAGWR